MGHQYDDYNRSLPDVFVGEFAANNGHHKTLQAAVAEAVFMVGFEQNGDKVRSPRRRARHSRETRQCRAVASAVASGEERPRRAVRSASCSQLRWKPRPEAACSPQTSVFCDGLLLLLLLLSALTGTFARPAATANARLSAAVAVRRSVHCVALCRASHR
jgi:hypothetical protein